LTLVEQWYFPVASRAWSLAADYEFARLAGLFIDRIGDNGSHNGADKADAHYNDDFFAFGAGGFGQCLDAFELNGVLFRGWDLELLALWTY
jgi:hypothetical protein